MESKLVQRRVIKSHHRCDAAIDAGCSGLAGPTHDAVWSSAPTHAYQDLQATSMSDSGAGHATPCAPPALTDESAAGERRLLDKGAEPDDIWLQPFDVGRLFVAAKGPARRSAVVGGAEGSENEDDMRTRRAARSISLRNGELIEVDEETQPREVLNMMGQVAALGARAMSMNLEGT